MTAPSIAGLELGGTKCVAILASGPEGVRDGRTIPTTDSAETLARLEAILDGWAFDAIGIASFGPLDLDRSSADFGSVCRTPKPGWSGADLVNRFSQRYAKPLAIQTDVVGAALAESRWGKAQGLSSHCYITVGTGVGVGLISGGQPVQGYAHGEAGHMRVARAKGDTFEGACPFHGDCIEGLLSGPALKRRFGRPGEALPDGAAEWDLFVADLAAFLHNLVAVASPERISIGGGVIADRPFLFARLREKLSASLNGYGTYPAYMADDCERIGPPGLGAQTGPLGAVAVGLGALGL
ncbi:ROK family protein [Sphingopyxis kveilinensis]|uniref:ROK family protein n=1 Tax=Sphingopyxis kveilinensis TaxID=3114367 RepID=UPI0030D42B3B